MHYDHDPRLHLDVHFDSEVVGLLSKLVKGNKTIMATLEELNISMTAIMPILDKVSADTDNLLAKLSEIPTGGLSPEQQEALDSAVASATSIASRLQAIDDKVPDSVPAPQS